jgi:hypothetical protein
VRYSNSGVVGGSTVFFVEGFDAPQVLVAVRVDVVVEFVPEGKGC